MNGFYYLSQPYNGTAEEKHYRATIGAEVTLQCILQGHFVFSPIAHNHALLQHSPEISLTERRDRFLRYDFCMLAKAKAMIVLQLPGWDKSYGVAAEIDFCQKNDIDLIYTTPESILNELDILCAG